MAATARLAEPLEAVEAPSALRAIEPNLPLLADLLRGDVVVYLPAEGGLRATAEAHPATVPSIYAEPQVGRLIRSAEEPAVVRVLATGRPARRLKRMLVHGAPTVQDVFPVRRDGAVVGAVVCEAGVIEHERQRRKSPVYRRALERLRIAALQGEIVGASTLSRLNERDGPMVVDAHGHITYISSVAESYYRKLGYTQSLLHRSIAQLQTDESAYYEAVESGACIQKSVHEGPLIWTRWAIPLPIDTGSSWLRHLGLASGRLDAVLLLVRDVTEDRQKEQELRIKSAYIQEIHHRVKNNLQTIASLLRLQARRTGSPEVGDILRQTINRILSIAVVHEFLSHDESSVIDVKEVCVRILNEVTQGILDPEKHIRFSVDGPDLPLPAQQATSCALIVNELLQNAVKHAFVGRSEGTVVVYLREQDGTAQIEIIDDGRGVGPGFDHRHQGSLGLQIVRTLVREDLRGEFVIAPNDPAGVRATITFPRTGRG
jgi:two-component sensor histidine kinase